MGSYKILILFLYRWAYTRPDRWRGIGLEGFMYIQHTVGSVVKVIVLVLGASSNNPVTLN